MTTQKIPKGWTITTLGEVAKINPTESLAKGKLAKSVAMESLAPFTRQISKFEIKEFNGGMKFRNGDTLLARITPCLENGKTSFVDILDDDEIGFGSTEYIVIREKETLSDKSFLYYFAISPRFRETAIKAMTGTSGRQRIQTDLLVDSKFLLPPLPEQRAIAAVLSSLDDKIELLRRQNKTLENIAQALFKRWFVDFEFPITTSPTTPHPSLAGGESFNSGIGEFQATQSSPLEKEGWQTKSDGVVDAEGLSGGEFLGYKSSGGKMIDSELGKIPEGWRVGRLENEFKIIMGQSPSGESYNENGEGMIFFQGRAEFQERFPMTRLYTTEPKRIADKFDILV